MLKNPYDRHEINRLEVTQVWFLCLLVNSLVSKFIVLLNPQWLRNWKCFCYRLFVLSVTLSSRYVFLDLQWRIFIISFFNISIDFICIPGCSSLYELWCQYGGIFLWNLQILRWWFNNSFNQKEKKKEYLGKDYSFSVVHLSNLFSWIKIWHLTHDPSMLFEHFFSSTDLGLNMLQTEKQQFHCDDCGICRSVSKFFPHPFVPPY